MRRLFFLSVLCVMILEGGRMIARNAAYRWVVLRDRIQLAAESSERKGHPWAGVYLSVDEWGHPQRTLCVAPEGEFYGAIYDGYDKDPSYRARGTMKVDGVLLTLRTAERSWYGLRVSLAGAYRLVRWGDVRCLIRPDEGMRFLECVGQRCKDYRPLCSRGYIYGDPDLKEELSVARRENAYFRPYGVISAAGPYREPWGLEYKVRINAGSAQGFTKETQLYWDDPKASIVIQSVGEETSTGIAELVKERGSEFHPPLHAGDTVYRWKLRPGNTPDFLSGLAETKSLAD